MIPSYIQIDYKSQHEASLKNFTQTADTVSSRHATSAQKQASGYRSAEHGMFNMLYFHQVVKIYFNICCKCN